MTDIVAADNNSLIQLSDRLALSPTIPEDLRGDSREGAYKTAVIAANVLAVVLFGREVGLGPMASLQMINLIRGRATLSAKAMHALVIRAGGQIEVVKSTDRGCTLRGTRGDTQMTVVWDETRKKRAGLSGTGWNRYPEDLYWARAVSTLCRRMWPDVILGAYLPEELLDDDEVRVLERPPNTDIGEQDGGSAGDAPTDDDDDGALLPTPHPDDLDDDWWTPARRTELEEIMYEYGASRGLARDESTERISKTYDTAVFAEWDLPKLRRAYGILNTEHRARIADVPQ